MCCFVFELSQKEHWDDNKIEKLETDISRLKKKKEEIYKSKIKICKSCSKDDTEKDFVKNRCYCKDCFKAKQKEKMRHRREKIT